MKTEKAIAMMMIIMIVCFIASIFSVLGICKMRDVYHNECLASKAYINRLEDEIIESKGYNYFVDCISEGDEYCDYYECLDK